MQLRCTAGLGLVLVVAGCMANNSSCGPKQPSPVPGCGRNDMGSCGNACCIMEFELLPNTTAAYQFYVQWLKKGGDDGSFGYVTGPDAAGNNPGDDLRQYGIAWDYVFQGTHTTTGGYVDKIDFNLMPYKGSRYKALMRASTVSGIHGALGDNGQTYKTLQTLAASTGVGTGPFGKIVHGCAGKH